VNAAGAVVAASDRAAYGAADQEHVMPEPVDIVPDLHMAVAAVHDAIAARPAPTTRR
jgi:hypothetical protein